MNLKNKVLLLLFVMIVCGMQSKVPQSEKEALLELFHMTHGAHWTLSWSLDEPIANWHGVEIENDHIIGLHLFNNNLVGQLPQSIYKLRYLKVLNVAFNQLSGQIPAEIGN